MPWPKGKAKTPEQKAKHEQAMADPAVRQKLRESRKGMTLSEEHRRNISIARLGHEVTAETREKIRQGHLGKTIPVEQREKISQSVAQLWQEPAYRAQQSEAHKGQLPAIAGRKHSDATRARLRLSHLGKQRTLASRIKQGQSISGSNHHNWKGGPLPSNHRGVGWQTIKKIVRHRAGGKCEFCEDTNVLNWQLDVHHIIPYREIPISTDWSCLGLCRKCHVRAERGLIDTSELQVKLRPLLEELLSQVTPPTPCAGQR